MNNLVISGVMPFSCNDYPKEISYVIFLGGCNFRCPYCHNSSIVNMTSEKISLEYVLNDINNRKKLIDSVVITGGEPTIYGESLIEFIKKIKELGFKIKLDTNGTNPDIIKRILNLKLINYIAMDIKNIFEKYNETSGVIVNINNIKESIELIENSKLDYEFRVTVSKTFHNEEDIRIIGKYVKNPKKLYVQNYQFNKEQLAKKDFISFSEQELKDISEYAELKSL